MKNKVLMVLLVLLIFGAGFVLGCVVVGYSSTQALATFTKVRLVEMATDMRMIRAGRSAAVLERYEDAVPNLLLQYEQFWSRHLTEHQRLRPLWEFKRYYEENPQVPMPGEVEGLLSELPPRPPSSCEADPCMVISLQVTD